MNRFTSAVFVVLLSGCMTPAEQPDVIYQVVSHQSDSGKWVIDEFDIPHKVRVRYSLLCFFSVSGNEHPSGHNDPSACSFRVGEKFAENALHRLSAEYVMVGKVGEDYLAITRGEGVDRVEQHLKIESESVMDYGNGP